MNVSKHTPGPWLFNDNSEYWTTHPFSVTVRKRGVHAVAVANIPARATIELSEAKANAQLIAAAPDLLDALVTMPQGMSSSDQDWWDWVDKARSAIDKATGGTR